MKILLFNLNQRMNSLVSCVRLCVSAIAVVIPVENAADTSEI